MDQQHIQTIFQGQDAGFAIPRVGGIQKNEKKQNQEKF
jgi:hypothetical protein